MANTINYIIRHTDNDGLCAGRIVYDALHAAGVPDDAIIGVPATYGKGNKIVIDFINEKINDDNPSNIFIVDLSIRKEDLDSLIERGHHIMWIDHHLATVEVMNNLDCDIIMAYENFMGVRTHTAGGIYRNNAFVYASTEVSAARLCWDVLFGGTAPYVVELISDHDVFRHAMPNSIKFFYGSQNLNIRFIKGENWDKLITHPDTEFINSVISNGAAVETLNKRVYSCIMRNSFEFKFRVTCKGVYSTPMKGIAVNTGYGNSFVFGDKMPKYALAATFNFTSNHTYMYTMYSKYNICYGICSKMGGGGHLRAAGFESANNIFDTNRIIDFEVDEITFNELLNTGECTFIRAE